MTTSTLWFEGAGAPVMGAHVRFSAFQCFERSRGPQLRACLQALGECLAHEPALAFYVERPEFLRALLKEVPALAHNIVCLVSRRETESLAGLLNVPVIRPEDLSR